ncbi:MAG: hypothetical protein WCT99_04265 [Bacteroidota bacterium]|jgi:hypothetical protein
MIAGTEFFFHGASGYSFYEFILRRYWRIDQKPVYVQSVWLMVIVAAATFKFISFPSIAYSISIGIWYFVAGEIVRRIWNGNKEKMLELFFVKNLAVLLPMAAACSLFGATAGAEWFDAIWNFLFGQFHLSAAQTGLYIAGFSFAGDGGTMIVRGVLNKFPKLQLNALKAVRSKGRKTTEEAEALDREEERTGEVLGILERWLILIFVLAGNYGAVAFVFAAKSVARFSVLDDKDFAEYYLLGTLLSVGTAVVTGIVINSLL